MWRVRVREGEGSDDITIGRYGDNDSNVKGQDNMDRVRKEGNVRSLGLWI